MDIFSKDFIIVPINEHAHWFLAIICYPGLAGPVDMSTGAPVTEDLSQQAKRPRGKPREVRAGCAGFKMIRDTYLLTSSFYRLLVRIGFDVFVAVQREPM